MNKLSFVIAFFVALFLGCQEDTISPVLYGKLKGKVVSKTDGLPIADAEITTTPISEKVFSAADGSFEIAEVTAGSVNVRVSKTGFLSGFETAVVKFNDSISLTIKLESDTLNNHLPSVPTYLSPANFAQNLPRNGTLRWKKAADLDNDTPLKYTVLLFKPYAPSADTLVSKQTDTTVLLKNLNFETTYLWQVVVFDNAGTPVFGPIWQFKTEVFPDNRFLFCRKVDGVFQIFSSNQTATTTVQLTDGPTNHWRPRMNPQRTKIAYLSDEGLDAQLFTMNRDGSDVQKITALPVAGFDKTHLNFCWSPDGSRLLYMNQNRLYRINADGSGLGVFTEAPVGFSFIECDWTAGGAAPKIAARTTGPLIYNSEILFYNESGAFESKIVGDSLGSMGGPMFSIDGSRLLFTRDVDGFQSFIGRQLNSQIFLKTIATGQSSTLPSLLKPLGTNDLDARFSPDGAKIIFVNTNNDGISKNSIWISSLNGSTRSMLFDDAEMPDWR